jgi:hypothetical protein
MVGAEEDMVLRPKYKHPLSRLLSVKRTVLMLIFGRSGSPSRGSHTSSSTEEGEAGSEGQV